jgi:hypothetical protein
VIILGRFRGEKYHCTGHILWLTQFPQRYLKHRYLRFPQTHTVSIVWLCITDGTEMILLANHGFPLKKGGQGVVSHESLATLLKLCRLFIDSIQPPGPLF